MIKTKREVVQEVLYEAYGGITSADDRISERFVLIKLNEKIAAKAIVSAQLLSAVDGLFFADDQFMVTFNDLPLLKDEKSGYKYLVLPAQPIGLPSSRSFMVYPPTRGACAGMDSTLFKPVALRDVPRMNSLPSFAKIFYFVKDGKMFFKLPKSMPGLNPDKVCLEIATADGGLDSIVTTPQDLLDGIKKEMVAEIRAILLGVPQEIKNDGVDILEPKA